MILFRNRRKGVKGVWKAVGTCAIKFIDGEPSSTSEECYSRRAAAAFAKRMNEERSES